MSTKRQVIDRFTDEKGVPREQKGEALQTDRAVVGGFESVTVAAGPFGAYRVDWISRLKLTNSGREVLKALTTRPYRRERMWVAPGIGVVKREIDYIHADGTRTSLTFELQRYRLTHDTVVPEMKIGASGQPLPPDPSRDPVRPPGNPPTGQMKAGGYY